MNCRSQRYAVLCAVAVVLLCPAGATRALVLVSRTVAAWPWACPEIRQPSWLALALWYAALLALGAWLNRRTAPPP